MSGCPQECTPRPRAFARCVFLQVRGRCSPRSISASIRGPGEPRLNGGGGGSDRTRREEYRSNDLIEASLGEASPNGWLANPGRSAAVARFDQTASRGDTVAEGRGPKHGGEWLSTLPALSWWGRPYFWAGICHDRSNRTEKNACKSLSRSNWWTSMDEGPYHLYDSQNRPCFARELVSGVSLCSLTIRISLCSWMIHGAEEDVLG